MEFKTRRMKWSSDSDGAWLMLLAPDRQKLQDFILALADKLYDCTIKPHREKRSLDANSYFWVLINELANVMRISKDECYLIILKKYGQSSVVSVIDEAEEMFKRSIKYYDDYGEADLNEKHFKHIKVFMGSSEYDTKQMSILIDGTISDCKELGIETMTTAEIERLKNDWGK